MLGSGKSESELEPVNEFVQNSIDDEGHFYLSKNLGKYYILFHYLPDLNALKLDMDRKCSDPVAVPRLVEQITILIL